MRVLKINELKETPMDTATPIAGWDRRAGKPDTAGGHRRRAIGKLSLQRGELPRWRDHRLACA